MRLRSFILPAMGFIALAVAAADVDDRVRALVAQLSDDDFETRDEATRALIDLGDAAWPSVKAALERATPEAAVRLKRVAIEIATLSEKEQCQAESILEKLSDENSDCRTAGMRELISMGAAGTRLLRKHLAGSGARIEFDAAADRTVIQEGESITLTAVARNTGTASAWIGSHFEPQWIQRSCTNFSGRRIMRRFRCGGCHSMEEGPLAYVRAFEPNGELKTSRTSRLNFPGIYYFDTGFYLADERVIELEGTTAVLNSGIDRSALPELARHIEVFVLPDLNAFGAEDRQLQLSCEPMSGARAGMLKYQIALKNTCHGTLQIAGALDWQGWYLWLDENNQPAEHGGWPVVYENDGNAAVTMLDPGSSLTVPLEVAPPKKPGRYSLLIGYCTELGGTPERSTSSLYSGELYLKLDNAAVVRE